MGIKTATGPAPTTPGGWGLRNPEPKEPGQRSAFFSQGSRAGDGRKWGGIMICANDPVTLVCALLGMKLGRFAAADSRADAYAALAV